jgi:hypothetical protein
MAMPGTYTEPVASADPGMRDGCRHRSDRTAALARQVLDTASDSRNQPDAAEELAGAARPRLSGPLGGGTERRIWTRLKNQLQDHRTARSA